MPKDWKDITDDEILNFDDAHTGNMARYERIIRHKSNIALKDVGTGLDNLITASIASADKIEAALQSAEKSSGKFQKATIALTVVIAIATVIYTFVTWHSVQVYKETNQIQREVLEFQKNNEATPSNKAL